MTTRGKDRQGEVPGAPQRARSGPTEITEQSATVPGASARSASQLKALTDLDEPGQGRAQSAPLFGALDSANDAPPSAANENAQVGPLPRESANHARPRTSSGDRMSRVDPDNVLDGALEASGDAADGVLHVRTEPDVATRPHTHVAPEFWFDTTLDLPGIGSTPLDPRQRLAWRYDAVFAAYKLLLPTSPTPEAREVMVNALRRYDKLLRSHAGETRDGATQVPEVLHAKLSEDKVEEMDLAMSELEVALLTLDECLSNDQFRTGFTKQHIKPILLLQYARFLAARQLGVGYLRDRFEALAEELLTIKLPSGRLQLMPRKRAGAVLRQLVRGLQRPIQNAKQQSTPISYMCDSLDRLQSLTEPKKFFDSGFFLDVYGYKISMHERITSPEFLYLCVAINVEVHNRLLGWSQPSKEHPKGHGTSLTALQIQLRAQQEAAQAVFENFHRPLAGSADETRAARKNKRKRRRWSFNSPTAVRFALAAGFVMIALAANLYELGVVRLDKPAEVLNTARIQDLSPLLINGRLSEGGKRFGGLIARPTWTRMSPRQRQDAAESLAQALKARGIEHAEVLAYKTRAIQIDFGAIVFVDGGK